MPAICIAVALSCVAVVDVEDRKEIINCSDVDEFL